MLKLDIREWTERIENCVGGKVATLIWISKYFKGFDFVADV